MNSNNLTFRFTPLEFAEVVCRSYMLSAKRQVMGLIYESIRLLLEDPRFHPEISTPEARKITLECGALQIMALSVELIEDFAAICYAYNSSIDTDATKFPSHLRDFGKPKRRGIDYGNVKKFYEGCIKNREYLQKISGLRNDGEELDYLYEDIKKMREFHNKYNRLYQGYKHAQSILHFSFTNSDISSNKVNFNYRIPDEIKLTDGFIEIRSGWEPHKELHEMIDLVDIIVNRWREIQRRQFPRLFKNDYDEPVQLSKIGDTKIYRMK